MRQPEDIYTTSDPDLISSVRIVDSCWVSDLNLVIAAINIDPVRSNSIHQMFRNLKNFDASQFHYSLRRLTPFTAPTKTFEEFSTRLLDVVSSELNKAIISVEVRGNDSRKKHLTKIINSC